MILAFTVSEGRYCKNSLLSAIIWN